MLFAGVTASRITRICITHFHGDHCLGLPGVLARMSLDRVSHPVEACYPAQHQEVFTRLRHAAVFRDAVDLREHPAEAGLVMQAAAFGVEARPLSHTVPALGYRLAEAGGRRMLPDRLAAFIMDTRLCDAAFELADGADMVVCESTFADTEAALAREYGHLTASQAGRIAAESRARLLVLTHFSQRYEHDDGQQLAAQAAAAFGGPVILAHDLDRIPVPARHPPATRRL